MKDILKDYIAHELLSNGEKVVINEDDNLLGNGLVDSVGMMSLVLFIEDTFEIDVPPEDVTIEHFLSINTIDAYLKKRQAQS